MSNIAAILNQPEATPGHAITRTAAPPLVVLGTTEDVRAGSVLLRPDVGLPESVHFRSKRYGSWKILTGEWIRGGEMAVRSGMALLLYSAGNQCWGPVLRPQQGLEERTQENLN